MTKQIYLAGSIAGKTFNEANIWRNIVTELLSYNFPNVKTINPLRGKETLQKKISKFEYANHPITTQKGIVRRDFNDVSTSDCVLVNLLGSESASIGTIMEIAWAYQSRIPVVLVMEKEGNPNDHLFVRECITFQTEDMEEAIDLCLYVLGELN